MDVKVLYHAFSKIYKTGEPARGLSYKVILKNGKTGIGEISAFPMHNKKGDVIGFRGIARNATERIQAEEALKEQLKLYRSADDTIPIPVFFKDMNGI